jgi:O-antigen/teichoic acid export membrane protein
LIVVHRAKLTINIDFKSQAKATLSAAVISGSLGIYLAYAGYGVWALVYQTLANSAFTCILFWFQLRWFPRNSFSYSSFKEMFSYGSKLLFSGLLETTFRNIYTIVIGKKFSATDLGYYSRADTFAQFGTSNFTGIMQRVTFPILSSIQDDNVRLTMVYRKYLRLSAFIIFPFAVGLAAVAEPFIKLLIGEKWLETVPLLQIVSFAYMWYPVHSINLNLLQVKGRSDLFLKLEIFKKLLGISILFITLPFGIKALCAGQIISSFLALILNTYYTDKLIKIGFFMQMRDLFPSLLMALSMGLFVYYSMDLIDGSSLKLLFGITLGVAYYVLIGFLVRSKDLHDLLSLLKAGKINN